MNDVKITKDCYVPKDNIKFYISYASNPVKNMVRSMRKEEKVFDFTYGKKINSVIYLKSDELILTALSVDTLHQRMTPKELKN